MNLVLDYLLTRSVFSNIKLDYLASREKWFINANFVFRGKEIVTSGKSRDAILSVWTI